MSFSPPHIHILRRPWRFCVGRINNVILSETNNCRGGGNESRDEKHFQCVFRWHHFPAFNYRFPVTGFSFFSVFVLWFIFRTAVIRSLLVVCGMVFMFWCCDDGESWRLPWNSQHEDGKWCDGRKIREFIHLAVLRFAVPSHCAVRVCNVSVLPFRTENFQKQNAHK